MALSVLKELALSRSSSKLALVHLASPISTPAVNGTGFVRKRSNASKEGNQWRKSLVVYRL